MIIKNVKIILAGIIISFAMTGTSLAGDHCGYYSHYNWQEGSIRVLKKDLEAKTNVTGKCPSGYDGDNYASIDLIFTSKTRHAEWERYNGSTIGISGTIEYRNEGYGPKPVIYNPKIRWE